MLNWWNGLDVIEQIFVCIAAPATVILLIQSVLLIFGFGFGGGADTDADTDFDSDDASFDGADSDGLTLFTIRGIVAFFAIGGWTGLALLNRNINTTLSVIIAFVAGFAALVLIAVLFKYSMRLQSSGNMNFENAIGKIATVYIPIPEAGEGKVNVIIQETLTEISAVSEDGTPFATGQTVEICGLIGNNIVKVRAADTQKENKGGISEWIRS